MVMVVMPVVVVVVVMPVMMPGLVGGGGVSRGSEGDRRERNGRETEFGQ